MMSPAIHLVTVVMSTVGFFLAPTLSRPGIFFGVTIEPGFASTLPGRRLLSSYRISIFAIAASILAIVGGFLWSGSNAAPAAFMGVWVQIAASVAVWIHCSNRARLFTRPAPPLQTASLEVRRPSLPGGWLFFCGPLLILIASALFLYFNWDSVPERYSVQRNPNAMLVLFLVG